MSKDKAREIFKEDYKVIPKLDPFVEFPRMRVSEINRINELIEKSQPLPMKKFEGIADHTIDACPRCESSLSAYNKHEYCSKCGQRVDRTTYEL